MIHNEISQATSLGKAIRRFIGIGDDQSGVERLGETLSPEFDIFGGFVPDIDWLMDRKRCGGQFNSPAAVGNQSYFLLANNSNDLLLIVRSARTDQTCSFGVYPNLGASYTGAAAAAQLAGVSDTRWRLGTGFAVAQAQTLVGNAAAPGPIILGNRVANALWEVPIVVGPGASFMVTGSAANTAINVECQWLERKLLPGERARFGVGS